MARHPILVVFLTGVLLLSGCAFRGERNPVPEESIIDATILGIPGARHWGDEASGAWIDYLKAGVHDAELQRSALYNTTHDYLALSGGGANGAFGAGLLKGWTARGDRPKFELVTGISTGALIAPFAFLGAEYDDQLEDAFTNVSTDDVFRTVALLRWIRGESVVQTWPLRERIAEAYDEELIEKIAQEHEKGRRLYVGTVNLDAGRPVVWDIGEIANSQSPRKVELIHQVILASASIPVVFPPEIIEVDVNGEAYDELHVDGGTASQVFVYPASINWGTLVERFNVVGTPNVYIVRNAFLEPSTISVDRKLAPIGSRSVGIMIRHLGVGDLYHIYTLCLRDKLNFNYINIPEDFEIEPQEPFDPVYMRALFDFGFEMGKSKGFWKTAPPKYEAPY